MTCLWRSDALAAAAAAAAAVLCPKSCLRDRPVADYRTAVGWFDTLLGRSRAAVADLEPDAVRKVLFDAVEAGDTAALAKACTAYENIVLERFSEWKVVPEAFRTPDKIQWYGPGIIAVAQHFATKMGHPELWAALTGSPKENPVTQWEKALEDVGASMAQGQYAKGAEAMRQLLERTSGLRGSGVDAYRPITLGRLGECLFQSGEVEKATAPTEQALAMCESLGDDAGVVSYLGNLYEIHRYRGDAVLAARYLERLTETLERLGDVQKAAAWRRQLSIVKAGEPLCRVVVEMNGRQYEVSEAPRADGKVRFIFERNRIALRSSTMAVDDGVRAGEASDFSSALAHFERAATFDPFDPWPHYHQGGTLLYLRRYRDAAKALAVTERLAPGFYHCRSDRWLAESLASGAIAHDTFKLVRELVDGKPAPEKAEKLAREGLLKANIGPLHLAHGESLFHLGRTKEAEDSYRRGLQIAEEPDVRTRLLVALGAIVGDEGEKLRVLHEAIELQGNLVASGMAAVVLAAARAS